MENLSECVACCKLNMHICSHVLLLFGFLAQGEMHIIFTGYYQLGCRGIKDTHADLTSKEARRSQLSV